MQQIFLSNYYVFFTILYILRIEQGIPQKTLLSLASLYMSESGKKIKTRKLIKNYVILKGKCHCEDNKGMEEKEWGILEILYQDNQGKPFLGNIYSLS